MEDDGHKLGIESDALNLKEQDTRETAQLATALKYFVNESSKKPSSFGEKRKKLPKRPIRQNC